MTVLLASVTPDTIRARCGFVHILPARDETALRYGRTATLLDLALEAGFNGKSTFNAAFKRILGETPTAFRARVDYERRRAGERAAFARSRD